MQGVKVCEGGYLVCDAIPSICINVFLRGAARPKGGCKPIGGMGDVCAGGM